MTHFITPEISYSCMLNRQATGTDSPQNIHGSKHGHMRELRTQHGGNPLRTLYAFDPRRAAIADPLYDEHLEELRKEWLIDD